MVYLGNRVKRTEDRTEDRTDDRTEYRTGPGLPAENLIRKNIAKMPRFTDFWT